MNTLSDPPINADDRFSQKLSVLLSLHNKKRADYGRVADPFANIRASAEFGIPPWEGAILRLNDKIHRIKSFIQNGKLVNESLIDSFQDIAVYAIIAWILYEEEWQENALRKMLEEDLTRNGVSAGIQHP